MFAMAKTKKKEVQKQGLRPSQKAKAEKLRKKQEIKANAESTTVRHAELVSASQTESLKTIHVKNAEGDPDTVAEILIQNKIDYTPKVSVVMPVYNVEPYLRQTLDSVLNQTLKEIELICVDDGSTDSSLDILKEYATKDNRITVMTQKNLYAGVARNAGLSQAKGEYLCFLDSDDFFEPEMLEESYNKAINDGADIVIWRSREYDTQTKEYRNVVGPVSPQLFKYTDNPNTVSDFGEKLFQANGCVPWNKLISSSLVNKLDIRYGNTLSSNDTIFIYGVLSLADKISLIDKVFVNYRVSNPNSLQRSKAKSWECICLAFIGLKKLLEEKGVYEQQKRTFVNKALQACLYYLNTVDENTRMKMSCALVNKYFEELDIKDYGIGYIYNKNFYEEYKTLISQRYIPIIFATDTNYAKYTSVSMNSILANKRSGVNICFFLLVDKEFPEKDKRKLTQQVQKYNSYIEFVQMDDFFESITMQIEHITYHTFYRLVIPKVFPFLNKLIYLDGDTIINGNIEKLYDIAIENYYLGGVIAPVFVNKKHQERLKINTENYVNAGVLLINNKMLIKDNLMPKFLDHINYNYDCQDQDIINVVCAGKIKNISLTNNLMSKYFCNYQKFTKQGRYSVEEFEAAMQHPFIIHYADKIKPWNDKKSGLASYWWKNAKETPYYGGYTKYIETIFDNKLISTLSAYFCFPINFLKLQKLKKIVTINYVLSKLTNMRIDIKNYGTEDNHIFIKGNDIACTIPSWFKNQEGQGIVVTSSKMKQKLIIRVVENGKLKIIFHAQKIKNGTPLWIDYKSIKVDGKEILSEPVATWHDQPYHYETPVKDGQEVTLEIEQQYHQYYEDELVYLLSDLKQSDRHMKSNVFSIINYLNKYIPVIDKETEKQLKLEKTIANVLSLLSSYRFDIKNSGTTDNSLNISATDGHITTPKWINNERGNGKVLQGCALNNIINVMTITDGVLEIDIKGPDKRHNGERFPLWIDYKSIRIDGKEILEFPIATWHDKPFHYKMPVKDGQEITIEFEQQYHQYNENELRETILKLYQNDDILKENIDIIVEVIMEKIYATTENNKNNAA